MWNRKRRQYRGAVQRKSREEKGESGSKKEDAPKISAQFERRHAQRTQVRELDNVQP